MDCICPRPAAIKTVLRVTCPENLGQIQRIILQRAGHVFNSAGGVPNPINALASWTPLLTAVDSTKAVITPYLEQFVIPQPEAITRGGNDNSTVNGVEQVIGYGGTTVTFNLTSVPASIIHQLRDLMCEPDLVWFGINQAGRIVCRDNDPVAVGDQHVGIPIEPLTLGVPDPGNNGFGTFDEATGRFAMAEGWSINRAIVTPVFNAKTQLLAPLV